MYLWLKRVLDVVGAVILLTVAFPLLILVFVFVYILDGPPIFFRQERAGRGGIPFEVIKIRTIKDIAHDIDSPQDSLTKTGRTLRRFGLDEVPQLINVIRGEMSLIGPRPILLQEASAYNDRQKRRLSVRPGLSGWAQVNGRNSITWKERIEMDLWYVENMSLWLDMRIALRTPWAVLSPRGVYGPGNYNPTSSDVREQAR